MASTSALPEPLKSSAASAPRDPLAIARTLAYQFALLTGERQAQGGIRDRVYGILKDAYWLGSFFMECPEAYQNFKDDDYWRDVRRKPNDSNIMRSVLSFVMRAKKQESLQNRACKYARVLEYLHEQELLPDEVPQRLKERGIDAIYAMLCRNSRAREGQRDGLEEPIGAPPSAPMTNLRTDDRTSDPPEFAAQAGLAGGDSDGVFPFSDDGGNPCKPVRALAGANERAGTFSDKARRAATSKKGPLNRIDLKTTLLVEMFECRLDEIVHAKRATICVVVQPRDERGRVRVVAQSVKTSNTVEGPWPGWPED